MTRRPRPVVPASTRAVPTATGTDASTPLILRSSSASSIVSGRVEPPKMPGMPAVSVLPGLIARMLVPNWENIPSM